MYNKVVVFVISIFLLTGLKVQAQYENVWAFGSHAGLDFTSGMPVAIRTKIDTREGCASICDAYGKLQFYTDGTQIWNRNHDLMSNGENITRTPINITFSSTQGTLIVPIPGKDSLFYVFSLASVENDLYPNLYYSLVDMRLNNGLGGVSTTESGILLDSMLTEEMTAVSGNDCNVWLLVASRRHPELKAFNIDANGVQTTPVISPTLDLPVQPIASMDVSPDRKKLALGSRGLVLYDFDAQTGVASTPILLLFNTPFISFIYSLCFSSDNSKLYLGSFGYLYQIALGVDDSGSITSSATLITQEQTSGLKRGPDGKIYCSVVEGRPALSVIHQPNQTGAACQYKASDVTLVSGTYCKLGLPNSVAIAINKRMSNSNRDTVYCADSFLLKANDPSGVNYLWEDGSVGPTRQVYSSGIYWVSYQVTARCNDYVDTFIVVFDSIKKDDGVSFIADTLVCINDLIRFRNTSNPNFTNLYWSFGDEASSMLENPEHAYTQAGIYEVRLIGVINDLYRDTFYKTIIVDSPIFVPPFRVIPDSICTGQSVTFSHSITSNTVNNLQWDFGDGATVLSTDPQVQHAYKVSGALSVTLSAEFRACPESSFTDTVYIYPVPKVFLGTDSILCLRNAPLILFNLALNEQGYYSYLWSTGETTERIRVSHPGVYSLTLTNRHNCTGSETVTIKKDCYIDIPNAFTPNGDGINDYFFPRQLLSRRVLKFKMKVLNRWGQVVFETVSIEGRGWDGKFNGEEQPNGVYIYWIDVETEGSLPESYKGNITLIR